MADEQPKKKPTPPAQPAEAAVRQLPHLESRHLEKMLTAEATREILKPPVKKKASE